ncbi:MAG: TldD/PmbA family protein, partial [Candidatus Promineifilaceae bacterium]
MEDLLARAMNLAVVRGAQYADIRAVHNVTESVFMKNGIVETVTLSDSVGFGVRVVADGAWGFASSQSFHGDEVDRVTDQALKIARASARVSQTGAVDLGLPVSSQGQYTTPFEIDPLKIPIEEKIDLLAQVDAIMKAVEGVSVRRGNLTAIREHKLFANTEGALTDQTLYEVGAGIAAMAVDEGEVQVRSYPNSHGRQQVTAGWEKVLEWDLVANAERTAAEAVQLLSAEPCPKDKITTVILGGSQLALQVHESCGHP